jgi:hypothetical protein
MYQSCLLGPLSAFFFVFCLATAYSGNPHKCRMAGAYLSPSNTYIHRGMTYHFHVLYASRLSSVLFWPLTSHIYTKPTNSTIRFPTFPTCVSRPFFSLRCLLALFYISSPMVSHSRVLNPRTGHTMNISHERILF